MARNAENFALNVAKMSQKTEKNDKNRHCPFLAGLFVPLSVEGGFHILHLGRGHTMGGRAFCQNIYSWTFILSNLGFMF